MAANDACKSYHKIFDAQSGEVLVGGVNVKNIEKEELNNTVSYVFQNSKLINASIRDNVLLGKPNASIEEVMSALKKRNVLILLTSLIRVSKRLSEAKAYIFPAAKRKE